MMKLADAIASQPEISGVRVGKVVTTSPLTISLAGGLVSQPGRLASYTPVVGHVVAMIRQDSTWLVLGRVVA